MPTKRVKLSERQRCIKACGNCARRKERCSGQVPCARCLQRRVADSCYVSPGQDAGARVIPSARSRSFSYDSSSPSHNVDRNDIIQDAISSDNSNSSDSGGGSSGSAVGCEGERVRSQRAQTTASTPRDSESLPVPAACAQLPITNQVGSLDAGSAATNPRTLWDAAGELIYLGDTADSTLLQDIQCLARDIVGDCDLVKNPLQHRLSDPLPQGPAQWTRFITQEGPAKPSLGEAKNLITFFFWVTTSFLDMFDATDLMQPLGHWATAPTGCEQYREQDTIYFLIFAIAAQADPASKESLADTYFAYGRYLVACHYSEQPSITAVQSYMLIAMYLFAAARRDAAFMYTGLATRAAYALGLHRDESEVSSPAEQKSVHQRVWKVVRVLDGYISTNLGRTPANSQSCGTTVNNRYSSTLALCQIFQEILDQIYSKRQVSSNMLLKISDRQRQWTSRLREGLENDGIPFTEYIDTADHKELNLGLLFIKSGYYWSIILLSRPFLVDYASSVASTVETASPATSPKSAETDIMVSACVDSAIHLIELFQRLANLDRLPKRLPFVVNTVHTASLILSLSVFLDFDRKLHISQYLERARSILVLFGAHDPLAKCNLAINESLQRCCDSYIKKRDQRSFRRQGSLVAQYFGSLKEPETLYIGTNSYLLPQDGSLSNVDLFDSDFNFLEPEISASFLTDELHPSLGNQGLEFTTSAIQSDFYNFIFPPDYTLFGSIDGGLGPLISLDACFTDGL